MAARRVNLGLLVLLALALLTGTVVFGVGVPGGRAAAIAHGVAGLGLVVLSPWKAVIVRRGLRRRRPGRWVSLALSALVVASVISGFAQAAGLRGLPAGLTTMQLHVAAALLAVPLGIWHVLARPAPLRRTDLSRRSALRAGRTVGAAVIAWGAGEALIRLGPLPGRDRRFTGSHETGSDEPPRMPVTQWLADGVPEIDPRRWRLTVEDASGMRTLDLAVLTMAGDRVRATIDCTGGWYATQDWEGIALRRVIADPGDARSILVVSHTGYARRLPVRDLDSLMLATKVGGAPLSAGHGAPARLVAPGRRGFWWVKWVTTIRADPAPWWWQPPFPLQ